MLQVQDRHVVEEDNRTPQHGPLAIFGNVLSWLPVGGRQRETVAKKEDNEGVVLFGFVPGSAMLDREHLGRTQVSPNTHPRQLARRQENLGVRQPTTLQHETALKREKLSSVSQLGVAKGEAMARPHAGVSKEELGRATWTLLHTLAAQYPEKPTRSQQRDVKTMVST